MKHKKHKNPFKGEEKAKNEEIMQENTDETVEESIQENVEESVQEAESKLQDDFDNLNNQYIRLAADFENYRKRQEQERQALIQYGAEDSLKKLIEVLDNFDRARESINNTDDINQAKEGFNVLYNQLFDNLSKLGLEVIEAQGKEFDPNFHEAVMQTPTSDTEENHVIMELQKGYKLGDKVLRPTLVNVATGE